MRLRNTWRSAWSLLLAMSVMLWSATLYADHMSGSAQVCHESMSQASHHHCGNEAESETTCESHLDSSPCCPIHAESAAQQCESAHECCLWDGQAPLSSALVLSNHESPTKQLLGAAAASAVHAPWSHSTALPAHTERAGPYTKPVEEKKTDLRI